MGKPSDDCLYRRVGKVRVWWVDGLLFSEIDCFDKSTADVILNYLYDVYERNIDIQVRFKWTPYASGEIGPS